MAIPVLGRWDLTVQGAHGPFPSWLEISETPEGLTGRFVGEVGSARPVPSVSFEGNALRFELPPQYEGYAGNMVFEGTLDGEKIKGTTNAKDGSTLAWEASPAPSLVRTSAIDWGQPIDLIGHDLSGWKLRSPDWVSHWTWQNGALVNSAAGSDLITTGRYLDFKLLAEYSYPAGSNSGIYLRGRYEFQVLDDFGAEPSVGSSGAIYGFLIPASNAVKPAGEVNRAEITLVGRRVTVVLNGVTIHDDLEIPGITGGALESAEGIPGPIFLQGDHGPVTYHRLVLTPGR